MIQNCSAFGGGGIWSNHIHRAGGTLEVKDCRAEKVSGTNPGEHIQGAGGRIFTNSFQSDGNLTIQHCTASEVKITSTTPARKSREEV